MEILDFIVVGNSVKAYLISFGIVLLALVSATIANRFLKSRLHALTSKTETELDDKIVSKIFSPITWLALIVGMYAAKENLHVNPTLSLWLDRVLMVFGLIIFFLVLLRLTDAVIEAIAASIIERIRQKNAPDMDFRISTAERVKKQVTEISSMVIGLIGFLTILANTGVDLKAIWASLGIGGIALVVAVKEPLSNLVGRLYIFGTGIFDEGHFIVFDKWAGTVKRVALFRTYMELFSDMTTVSIPNADFIKGAVKNYYGRTKFMYKWDLDVPYDTSAERLQELVMELRTLIKKKEEVNEKACYIYVDRLDRYSKVVRVWFQAYLPDWSTSLFYGNEVLNDIQLLFARMNLDFAFPTQTIQLKGNDKYFGPSE